MCPVPKSLLIKVIEITSRFPRFHGAPLHVGDPAAIGIANLKDVDWGKQNTVGDNQVPAFWAFGITAQAVDCKIGIPEMITHNRGTCSLLIFRSVTRLRLDPRYGGPMIRLGSQSVSAGI